MTVRTLTVSLTDLGLDAVEGCRVTLALVRSGVESGSIVIPTVKLTSYTDVAGVCTFSITPNETGSRFEAKVFNASGKKVVHKTFAMPDANAALSDLIDLSSTGDNESTPVQRAVQTPISVTGLNAADVQTAVGLLVRLRIKEITSPHTIIADDLNYNTLVFDSASACSLIWPAQSELAIGRGTVFNVRNAQAGTITYSRSAAGVTAGDTLGGAGTVLTGAAAQKVSSIYLEKVTAGVNRLVTIGAFSS